jgi:hypothetical protein
MKDDPTTGFKVGEDDVSSKSELFERGMRVSVARVGGKTFNGRVREVSKSKMVDTGQVFVSEMTVDFDPGVPGIGVDVYVRHEPHGQWRTWGGAGAVGDMRRHVITSEK